MTTIYKFIATLMTLFLFACGEPYTDQTVEVSQVTQAVSNPYGGSYSIGWRNQNYAPYTIPCLTYGNIYCFIPYPSWYAGFGAGSWNYWRYFDPSEFASIHSALNIVLGGSASTNGFYDAWQVISANSGTSIISLENPGGSDMYLVGAIKDQTLYVGNPNPNANLPLDNVAYLQCLEDGGTLTDNHPTVTYRYCRTAHWRIDTGALSYWISQNCSSTDCRRRSMKKFWTLILGKSLGAPGSEWSVSNSDPMSPWIFPGGPNTSQPFPSRQACYLANFTYGSNLTYLTVSPDCAYLF